jgi:uncharacterized protein (TIGR02118 family)
MEMIRVSVFYPNSAGCKFDMDYYLQKHIPMARKKIGAALKGIAVEQGLSGGAPGTPATYIAIGHLLFDSVEAFQAAFGPHAEAIAVDVSNYTNVQPIIQIGEVKM